jgi:hypothetical protein
LRERLPVSWHRGRGSDAVINMQGHSYALALGQEDLVGEVLGNRCTCVNYVVESVVRAHVASRGMMRAVSQYKPRAEARGSVSIPVTA